MITMLMQKKTHKLLMLSPYYLVIIIPNHHFLSLCQKGSLFHLLLLPKGTIKSISKCHEEIIEVQYVVRIILKVPPTVHGSLVSIHFSYMILYFCGLINYFSKFYKERLFIEPNDFFKLVFFISWFFFLC